MSVIQQHSNASLSDNWRTVNIDLLDPESSSNFDTTTLYPPQADVSEADVRQIAGQCRQLLRGGDAEGALRGALESAPRGASDAVKEIHLATVTEILQSIKASEMTPMLQRIYSTPDGSDVLDMLMSYLYKGMAVSHPEAARRGGKAAGSGMTPQNTGGFSQMGGRNAASDPTGAQMSVLLSWHEKVVDVAGQGAIVRCMTDRRRV